VAGPPVIFVAVPWLLLGLLLAAPFALLLTFVALAAALVALVGVLGAIVAAPVVLVRRLRSRRRRRRPALAPTSQPAGDRTRPRALAPLGAGR
jgi:hypothetical protein